MTHFLDFGKAELGVPQTKRSDAGWPIATTYHDFSDRPRE
jgi:hypothetical protein